MNEINLEEVKKRTTKGILALVSRTFFLQALSFATTFTLTIFLEPSVFGIFFVVSAVIGFLGYFSDIGLAAALVQKKEAMTDDDLKTTFTIQQLLVGILVLGCLYLSTRIGAFYSLDQDGLWLLRALIISFFLSSLKTIPSVILERRLDFNRLVIPQIVETLLFSIIVVVLAINGYGIKSFSWAVLVRGLSGVLVIYALMPWRISFGFSKNAAKNLLSYGLPFQANSVLALIKDDLLTIFLGKMLSFGQIGYLGWAKKWAEFPLRLVMDNIIKVSFPSFARLQENKSLLRLGIEKALFLTSLTTFPILMALIVLIPRLSEIVPRYQKWQPAIFVLYLYCLQAGLSSISTIFTNTLNALGKIKTTLLLMLLWTFLTWIFTLGAISLFGFQGVALAAVLVALTIFLPVFFLKKIIEFDVWKNIYGPILSSLIMGFCLYLIMPLLEKTLISLGILGILGGIIYLGAMWSINKTKLSELIIIIRKL